MISSTIGLLRPAHEYKEKTYTHIFRIPKLCDVIDYIAIRTSMPPKSYSINTNLYEGISYSEEELKILCPPSKRGVYKMPKLYLPHGLMPFLQVNLTVETVSSDVSIYVGGYIIYTDPEYRVAAARENPPNCVFENRQIED